MLCGRLESTGYYDFDSDADAVSTRVNVIEIMRSLRIIRKVPKAISSIVIDVIN